MGHGFQTPGMEMRQFQRRPHLDVIDYTIVIPDRDAGNRELRLKGSIVDISEGGMGIQADYPLRPGYRLQFLQGKDCRAGVVRWSTNIYGRYHRAGLAFESGEHGMQYPVELAEDDFFIGEDREKYARALDAKTDEYLDSLRRLEEKCTRADADRDAILDELVLLNDAMMDACFEFEKAAGHDSAILEKSRMLFHEKTDSLLSKSNIFRHARTWPRGCQGDYKMLETLYRNIPLSEGIGYYIDRYGLSLPLAEAVRNRIQVLEEILREELRNRQSPAVLNMACGSCRELMGLAPDIVRSGASVVCIDHDGDSLAFALDRLSYTEAAGQIEFRKYNAIRMFDDELNRSEFGTQDIIYSVGLFDYLPSDFLVKMFAALYRLLNPGGMLIAAFKDAAQYRSQDFHWFVAWDGFLQRTEYEFRAVLHDAGIPANAMKERRDETGIIIFYEITRNEA